MEVKRNSKGGVTLIHLNHMYHVKKKQVGVKVNWVCVKHYKLGCTGSLTTDDPPTNVLRERPHNHLADETAIECFNFKENLKEAARNSFGRTNNILLDNLQNVSDDALVKTPLTNSLKRTIQRQRKLDRPEEPSTLADIHLVNPWTTTGDLRQLPFLIHDSGEVAGDDRMIVFGADDALEHLASSDTWFIDGNFKVSPLLFTQIYVIRSKLDNGAISCVYAFLPGKEQRLYVELFQAIQNKFNTMGIQWNLRNVNCDFERAAFNAVRQVFGANIRIAGCFFHLKQSTFRRAVELGLRQYIVDGSITLDEDMRNYVGMIDAMAFVPIRDIPIAVLTLQDPNNIPSPLLTPLLEYFLTTYVEGAPVPGANPPRNHPPLFPPTIWNMFQITLENKDRTNNICEGWNNAFNVLVGQQHPPFYMAVEKVQKDYIGVRRNLLRSRNGIPLTQVVRHEVRTYNNNLRRLVEGYNNNQFLGNMRLYLSRISHNIRY